MKNELKIHFIGHTISLADKGYSGSRLKKYVTTMLVRNNKHIVDEFEMKYTKKCLCGIKQNFRRLQRFY